MYYTLVVSVSLPQHMLPFFDPPGPHPLPSCPIYLLSPNTVNVTSTIVYFHRSQQVLRLVRRHSRANPRCTLSRCCPCVLSAASSKFHRTHLIYNASSCNQPTPKTKQEEFVTWRTNQIRKDPHL